MAKTEPKDFIQPLAVNGFHGRILRLSRKKGQTREILFVSGQHTSLERWWGLLQAFNQFGSVTLPDMPGFGGMESLYAQGKPATIDNLADYLADFIKQEFKHRRLTIAGMSLAFVVVTRMLQRHPELTKQVDILVSLVGLAHHEDFGFTPTRKVLYRAGSWAFSGNLSSKFFRNVFLRPGYLRRVYKHSFNAREKFKDLAGDEFTRTMDMELHLWKINDIRTQMKTNHQMLTLDNTGQRIDLDVYHVAAPKDRYLNNKRVEQHLAQIYKKVHMLYTKENNHAPTVIADLEAAAPFLPEELRALLLKQPKA